MIAINPRGSLERGSGVVGHRDRMRDMYRKPTVYRACTADDDRTVSSRASRYRANGALS